MKMSILPWTKWTPPHNYSCINNAGYSLMGLENKFKPFPKTNAKQQSFKRLHVADLRHLNELHSLE